MSKILMVLVLILLPSVAWAKEDCDKVCNDPNFYTQWNACSLCRIANSFEEIRDILKEKSNARD